MTTALSKTKTSGLTHIAVDPPHEVRFHTNILELSNLIHELIALCYESGYNSVHPTLVKLASEFLGSSDKKRIINNFIYYSWYIHDDKANKDLFSEVDPIWDKIITRDESFFINHAKNIFRDLPMDKVDAFKILFTAKNEEGEYIINQMDRNAIWDYFDSFVKICIKYIHDMRQPNWKNDNGQLKKLYKVKFYPEIKLTKYCKHYGIELKWPDIN